VVGVGEHRQGGDTADARGLLDEFAEGNHGDVRRGQHFQRGHRSAEDADFEAQIAGHAGRHRVEHRGAVIAGIGGQECAKRFAQAMGRNALHDHPSRQWAQTGCAWHDSSLKSLCKQRVNAPGTPW
jgi:hypothetical protein